MVAALTIAAAQPETSAHDVAANAVRHADAIRAARARVVVFPELSLTGYEFDAEPVDPADPRTEPIRVACADTGTLALVGAPVTAPGTGHSIAMLAFDAGGGRVAYRKMWLGAEEAQHFVAGVEPAAVDVDGWRLGLAICKDTGVADHVRATVELGIDAYVAGVLEHATDRDVQPDRARWIATTHRVWVVTAGFAGPTGEGFDRPAGGSGIWRPDGAPAAQVGPRPGEIARSRLSST